MSPIKRTTLALSRVMLSALCLLVLAGCGDGNSRSSYDPERGEHAQNWLPADHATAAQKHLQDCTPCHGTDLAGGISQVPCTRCHLGLQFGPGGEVRLSVHPFGWGAFTYALHAPYVRQNGTGACATEFCHGTNLQGASGPSCTACHLGGPLSAHPQTWGNQVLVFHGGYVQQNGTASCRNATCHGTNLQGVFLSGPACSSCHANTVFP